MPFIRALRPLQWIKNGLVFAAPLFAFTLSPETLGDLLITFVLFCAVSSGSYLLNDLQDIEFDRLHPVKRTRPLASGQIRPATAAWAALLLVAGSLAASWWVNPWLTIVLSAYVTSQALYNLSLKHVLILDLMVLASGFVLRAISGAVSGRVPISPWFLFCVGLLSFFVALEKRKGELKRVKASGIMTRRILADYSVPYIQQIETAVLGCLLVGYALWTIQGAATPWMMLTLPFVLYGLLRYQFLSQHEIVERPEEALVRDLPLLLNVLSWIACCILILALDG